MVGFIIIFLLGSINQQLLQSLWYQFAHSSQLMRSVRVEIRIYEESMVIIDDPWEQHYSC